MFNTIVVFIYILFHAGSPRAAMVDVVISIVIVRSACMLFFTNFHIVEI